jgi:hypothetical protein
VTELYFKSVMQKGQTLDAFFTLNLNPRLNFRLHIKAFVRRVITLISQAQGILDLQKLQHKKMSAILPMLILRVRIF